jgi:hypothetical protein
MESRGRPFPVKYEKMESRGRPFPGESYGIENIKYNATIPQMVNWFKTMTTNEYIRGVKKNNWPRFNRKLWQKNYYDHIIRSENDLFRIRNYIKNNPKKWRNIVPCSLDMISCRLFPNSVYYKYD